MFLKSEILTWFLLFCIILTGCTDIQPADSSTGIGFSELPTTEEYESKTQDYSDSSLGYAPPPAVPILLDGQVIGIQQQTAQRVIKEADWVLKSPNGGGQVAAKAICGNIGFVCKKTGETVVEAAKNGGNLSNYKTFGKLVSDLQDDGWEITKNSPGIFAAIKALWSNMVNMPAVIVPVGPMMVEPTPIVQ